MGRADRRRAARRSLDGYRLAYVAEAPVNWCPGLGTVLANEEVTADGRSERGNFPVFRRNLRQWMMRITAYADRLLDDLDRLDWPESVKAMQRNWIGRSDGRAGPVRRSSAPTGRRSRSSPPGRTPCSAPPTWCWRPSTRWSTRSPPAPGRPDTDPRWTGGAATPAEAVAALPRGGGAQVRPGPPGEQGEDRRLHRRVRRQPGQRRSAIPVFIADYVLMGYGTGAIMAVPGQDQRDWEFADGVRPADHPHGAAARRASGRTRRSPATARRSTARTTRSSWTAWTSPRRRRRSSTGWRARASAQADDAVQAARLAVLPAALLGRAVPDRLRRATASPIALPDDQLPVELPEVDDYSPAAFDPDDADSEPVPPLARADRVGRRRRWTWATARRRYRRETEHDAAVGRLVLVRAALPGPDQRRARSVDPEVERYWMGTRAAGRPGRRRPVRRRRRARGAAPAVRAVLAQGAVRPGPRQLARSRSAGCSTRATSRRTPTPTSAASTCRPRRSSRRRRRLHVRAASRSPASTGRWASP